MGRVTELEFQVDDLQQGRVSNRVLITGPAAEAFISNSEEQRDNDCDLGLHSENKLRMLIATKIAPDEMSAVVPTVLQHSTPNPLAKNPSSRAPVSTQPKNVSNGYSTNMFDPAGVAIVNENPKEREREAQKGITVRRHPVQRAFRGSHEQPENGHGHFDSW